MFSLPGGVIGSVNLNIDPSLGLLLNNQETLLKRLIEEHWDISEWTQEFILMRVLSRFCLANHK